MSFTIEDADRYVAQYLTRELMKDEYRDKIVSSAEDRGIFLTDKTKEEIRESCGRVAHWLAGVSNGSIFVDEDPTRPYLSDL